MIEFRVERGGSQAHMTYPEPMLVAEVRARGGAALAAEQHRAHCIDLARWLAETEQRTGRTVGSLLASEAREHRRRTAAITELAQLRSNPMTTAEARRALGL